MNTYLTYIYVLYSISLFGSVLNYFKDIFLMILKEKINCTTHIFSSVRLLLCGRDLSTSIERNEFDWFSDQLRCTAERCIGVTVYRHLIKFVDVDFVGSAHLIVNCFCDFCTVRNGELN